MKDKIQKKKRFSSITRFYSIVDASSHTLLYKVYRFFMSLPFLFALCSCGGGDNTDSNTEANVDEYTILGPWATDCIFSWGETSVLTPSYIIEEYLFLENDYSRNYTQYEDEDCTIESGYTSNHFGTYSIGEDVTTANGFLATRISMVRNSDDLPEGVEPEVVEWIYRIADNARVLYFGRFDENGSSRINYNTVYR